MPEARPFVKELFGLDIIIQTLVNMITSGNFPRKQEEEEEKKITSDFTEIE